MESEMSAVIKGGFFAQYGTTLSTAHTRSALRRRAAFALSRKQTLGLQELMLTLDGAAAGSTASKTLSRVAAATELGGKRTVETQTLVSRATVAGDITDINADILSYNSYDSTPVMNGDGNKAIMTIAH
jgi:hypothetical protein